MQTLIKPQEVVNTGLYRAAPVNARFDINLISPYILSTEERFLIPVLGRAFYDDLVAEQNTAVSNYNPDAGALVSLLRGIAIYYFSGCIKRYIFE